MLLTFDKILIIVYRKNQNLWSMYITIENLNCAIRKNQIRFNLILLNLISIIEKTNNDIEFVNNINSKLYHKIFRHMLKRELIAYAWFIVSLHRWQKKLILKNFIESNLNIKCANFNIRRYYFIITNIIIDYSKQYLIIDVKQNTHCFICKTSSNKKKIWSNDDFFEHMKTREIKWNVKIKTNRRNEKITKLRKTQWIFIYETISFDITLWLTFTLL